MNMLAFGYAAIGLFSTLFGLVDYMRKMKKSQTPRVPIVLGLASVIGITSGVYAIALSSTAMGVTLTAIPLAITVLISGALGFFLVQKNTPIGELKVKVGDSLIPFEANDHNNLPFTLDNLQGQRTLLKFYRGSWCPYCSAELKMFSDMTPAFEQYGVKVIALSNDSVAQAHAHIERDTLNIDLLSDTNLDVIRAYGVEHHKALGWDSENIRTYFGISVSLNMFKYRSMSIPTTLLVDEHGIIQWIDQSDDYRIRASRENILKALEQNFSN